MADGNDRDLPQPWLEFLRELDAKLEASQPLAGQEAPVNTPSPGKLPAMKNLEKRLADWENLQKRVEKAIADGGVELEILAGRLETWLLQAGTVREKLAG
jgi:hypothetical protein